MKDYFGYAGKVCVVTGAASGMGKATTEMLVDLGAEVYALDWVEVTVPGIKRYVHVNLGEKASIDAAFAQLPNEIDRFFGIAGVSGMKTDYITTVKINFISNKYMIEEYLTKRMKDGGAVAFIISSGGLRWEKPDNRRELQGVVEAKTYEDTVAELERRHLHTAPGPLGYVFSKRAMCYLVAWHVATFGQRKIRINAVLPGPTQSGMTDEFAAMKGGMDKLLESSGFAGRLATSAEMAAPIVFLNSDMASYISGELLGVDFGDNLRQVAGLIPDTFDFRLFG